MSARRVFSLGFLLLAMTLTAACEARMYAHGTPMTRIELADIAPGVDTRGSVQRQLGQPAIRGLDGDNRWYYVSTQIARETYKARQIAERRVIAISFDDLGVVTDVEELGLEDGQQVALRTETTPTYGRELTVAQQLFGNIGRGVPGLTQQ